MRSRVAGFLSIAASTSALLLACVYSVPDVVPTAPSDGAFFPFLDAFKLPGTDGSAASDASVLYESVKIAKSSGVVTAMTVDERTSTLLFATELGTSHTLNAVSLVDPKLDSVVVTNDGETIKSIAGVSSADEIVFLGGSTVRKVKNAPSQVSTFVPADGVPTPILLARGLDVSRQVTFAATADQIFEVGYGTGAPPPTRLEVLLGAPSSATLVPGGLLWFEANGNQQVLARKDGPTTLGTIARSTAMFAPVLAFSGTAGAASTSARTIVAMASSSVMQGATLCTASGDVSTLAAASGGVVFFTESGSNVIYSCDAGARVSRVTLLDGTAPIKVTALVAFGDFVYVAGASTSAYLVARFAFR